MRGSSQESELSWVCVEGVKGAKIGTGGERSRLAKHASTTMRCEELVGVARNGRTYMHDTDGIQAKP